MRIFVSVTDKNWFTQHASRSNVDEVNFWRPSPNATFKALDVGELLLFKLHSPDNFIVGGGFFTKFPQLPVNMVWDYLSGGKRRIFTSGDAGKNCLLQALSHISNRESNRRLHHAGGAFLLASESMDTSACGLQIEHSAR